MNAPRCSRLWQAEARIDGRLDASDAASFDRHAPGCEECAKELSELRRLVVVMGSSPDARASELGLRRARLSLLKAADEQLLGRSWRWLPFRAPALGLAAAVGVAAVILLVRPGKDSHPPAGATVVFEVRDEGAARWTETRSDGAARVSMQEGKAGFHVEKLAGSARFVVALPDGEITVRGTRFTVLVAGGRTREITVTEGSVSVAVAGFVGTLEAGQRWTSEDARPTTTAGVDGQGGSGATETHDEPGGGPGTAANGPPAMSDTASPDSAPSASAPGSKPTGSAAAPGRRSIAGARFAEAMAAFSAGDYSRADRLFAAFVREFPSDARAEDATFLRAEARARRGDKAGAEAAAQEYLKAYPKGLRRPEAGQMAADAGAP